MLSLRFFHSSRKREEEVGSTILRSLSISLNVTEPSEGSILSNSSVRRIATTSFFCESFIRGVSQSVLRKSEITKTRERLRKIFAAPMSPKNKAAFNELLRVEYQMAKGDENVEIKVFDEITNFTADLNLNRVYALLDKKEYKAAEEILDKIIDAKEEISEKVFIRARAQKIYINLITKNLDEAKEYYDKEVPVSERREISNDVSMASIRAYLLMSGLLDKSRSECIIALNNVYRAFKHTPKNRQPIEIALFNEALDKVIAAHPDWELEGYRLQEVKK